MTLGLIGLLMAIVAPRLVHIIDRIAVRSAASEVGAVLGWGRDLAIAGRIPVAVHVRGSGGTLELRREGELLLERHIGSLHGVGLQQTRDSMAYDSWGLGVGAANLSIVVRRRAAVETVFVSRLGRVR